MQVIVINSQKGGSGKTMLAKHLSVEAERAGDGPAFVIDTDPQATLTTWHAKRVSESPGRAEVPFLGLRDGLELLRRHGASYCFIDTPSGRIEVDVPVTEENPTGKIEVVKELFRMADFVVFPVQPSDDDLGAVPRTVQLLNEVGVPFMFVLTRVKPGTLITAQAAALLSKHGEVAETFINDRTGYKSPWPKGQTIAEAQPRGAAAQEIEAVWDNIKSCLHANMQTTTRKVKVNG
jgi:chromosome partitioning protein